MGGLELPAARKRWWRAVWRGLVVDPEAKHYRTMGTALWLFVYLVIHAVPESGVVYRKYKTIARDMGISPRTARSWLVRLTQNDYVSVRNTGRSLVIHIQRWKSARASRLKTQMRPVSGTPMTH